MTDTEILDWLQAALLRPGSFNADYDMLVVGRQIAGRTDMSKPLNLREAVEKLAAMEQAENQRRS